MAEPSAQAEATRRFGHQLHRRYGLYTLGVIGFIVLLAGAERLGWSRGWIGAMFLIGTVGVYALIGLLSRTTDEAEYYVAGRRVPALYNGMATAADWMSAASFIGTAGVLYLQGYAGLAYILGWTGGYCLVALLLAPYLRRFGQFTIPDFIGARYGGQLPRLLAVAAAVMVSFVYVVVQLYGVGLITSHLTGFSFEVGIFVGLGGVLVCSFLGGMRAVTWTQVAQYIVLIIAYLVPVAWLSLNQTGHLVSPASYGAQLQKVTEAERRLSDDPREKEVRALYAQRAAVANAKLADVPAAMAQDARQLAGQIERMKAEEQPLVRIQQAERRLQRLPRTEEAARQAYERERDTSLRQSRPLAGMPPQALPYAAGDPDGDAAQQQAFDHSRRNFIALVLCLMMGTAAMPHVLTRYYTTPSVSAARRSVGWSLFFIALLYVAAPALAVMVKYEVFSHLVGMPFDELPSWLRRWAKLDPSLVSVEDINLDGILQLSELRLGQDVIVLAAPEIGGLPFVVTYLVAAGGLAAALSTADGLLLTIANALSHDVYYRVINPRASAIRRVMLSKVLVLMVALLAAWLASLRITDILQYVSAAFSLAASAFFPALTLGVFWRRATRLGAICAMLSGLGLCAWYMVINLPWLRHLFALGPAAADLRWWGIEPMAAGVFGVPLGMAVLLLVSLVTPRPSAEEYRLLARLRAPGPAQG
ncbi:VC_2705 family sodium/solute symporter [Ideonella sp. BN130291]|uniref:VC_2705 family sodium/solute symporter n=1 Tax=Ideonella sp. BN130291 TaxID=3112940 RepID=UPI002E25C96B|nr:VC_2705 family sodium/solute symporter [Ideonella sp. BN130291]